MKGERKLDKTEGKAPEHLSYYQDEALRLCIEYYGVCPFGCVKDGAPNCNYFVRELLCEPARITRIRADPKQAQRAGEWWNILHERGQEAEKGHE